MEQGFRVIADDKGAAWRVSPRAGPAGEDRRAGVLWLAAEAEGRPPLVIIAHGDSLEALSDEELRAAIRLGRISGELPAAPRRGRARRGTFLWLLAGGAVASIPLLRRWIRERQRGARAT